MRKLFIMSIFCGLALTSSFAANNTEIALWPDGVPESNGITGPEIVKNGMISNISTPSMTVFPADSAKNTGVALLICPGGGYSIECAGYEGTDFAQWLSENGITGIVLKYRLPNGHSNIPLKDAQQAMRIIRSRAAEWGINPAKIGISGFSAGGHLASTAGTHFDMGKQNCCAEKTCSKSKKKAEPQPVELETFSCRPDFMILFYPVISMQEALTHGGSRTNLLGNAYNRDSVNYYSNEMQVTKDTPPTLLLLSDNDKTVMPQNSVNFYTALKSHGIPASMYIFPEGGHGWGLKKDFRYHEFWKGLCMDFLKQQKFVLQN